MNTLIKILLVVILFIVILILGSCLIYLWALMPKLVEIIGTIVGGISL